MEPLTGTDSRTTPGSDIAEPRDATRYRILVVDDEEPTRTGLRELIEGWGYQSLAVSSAEDALKVCADFSPHVFLSDMMMPGIGGLDLMAMIRERHPQSVFILLTGYGTIENATQAMRQGAYDYLTKPVDLNRLKVVLEKAIERVTDREEVSRLTRDLAERGKFGDLVGRSPVMQQVYRIVEQAAPSRASVLITGESGTGKEMVARTLHARSPRRNRPFVAINCAAIPQSLLESEIFGHERGAFTGAMASRQGCFELANGGTLLLDEIGEMAPELQAKLLRVLEERVLRRVGGKQEIPVDVRVISSTNTDITQALQKGTFREDLYYRLNVFTIHLPPLRDRPQDVHLLAQHFVEEYALANQKEFSGFSPAALDALKAHPWPGNVRELRNVIERAVIVGSDSQVELKDLPSLKGDSPPRQPAETPLEMSDEPGPGSLVVAIGTTVEEAERRLIFETLKSTQHNKTRAAEILGISTKTLHNKLRRYRQNQARNETG